VGYFRPIFLEARGRPVTVTAERYQRMLVDYVIPSLESRGIQPQSIWFQQDGAAAHTTASTLECLQGYFPGRVISNGGSVGFAPRSPDLTVPDFFLWGWLKTQVYQDRPRNLGELKRRIKSALAALPQHTTQASVEALPHRAGVCLSLRGGHLEAVLLR